MSPDLTYTRPMLVVDGVVVSSDTSSAQMLTSIPRVSQYQYAQGYSAGYTVKTETKKEKTARVAKEKMLASWKTFDQRTETIIKIKQICKPRHRIGHIGGRRNG